MTDFAQLAQPGISGISPYQQGKPLEELQRELGVTDVIKLASNENPLGASQRLRQGLQAALAEIARYPDGNAFLLKQKLGALLGVQPGQLTIGNGSNDALELIARVFLGPGLEAVVAEHAFAVYPLVARALGAGLKTVPAQNYGQDLEATLAALGPSTRMVFVANPNNPTGTWVTGSQFLSFIERVPPEVIVVLDEAYREYAEDLLDDYPNGLSLLGKHPNLVVTRTFSKAYGLAGLRLGYAVSHPDIANLMNRVRQPFNVNALSLAAALIALDDQAHVRESVRLNREGMAYLSAELQKLSLPHLPSAGNFLTIDFGRRALPIYESLLREGVIVRPLEDYAMPHHLRATIGTPAENRRLVAALAKALGASQ